MTLRLEGEDKIEPDTHRQRVLEYTKLCRREIKEMAGDRSKRNSSRACVRGSEAGHAR